MKQQKRRFKHITRVERIEISILLNKGYSMRNIAKALDRSVSSISDEIRKNTVDNIYDPKKANHKAYVKRKYSKYQGQKINQNNELKQYIEDKIRLGWSPEIISQRMKLENKSFYSSKTAIYEFLYSSRGQYLCPYLFSRQYRPRRKKGAKRTMIPNRVGIGQRPVDIGLNTEYGHFEGDAIVSGRRTGSKACLSVVYERKSKYVDIRKISSLSSKLNNKAIDSMKYGLDMKSLTLDNGIENVKHEQLGIDTYFCDPYSSWQKGGVENVNRLIRRYVPKGCDINNYSHQYIKNVVNRLNNIPRKSLDYKTPLEVMIENNQFKCDTIQLSIKKQTGCSV